MQQRFRIAMEVGSTMGPSPTIPNIHVNAKHQHPHLQRGLSAIGLNVRSVEVFQNRTATMRITMRYAQLRIMVRRILRIDGM